MKIKKDKLITLVKDRIASVEALNAARKGAAADRRERAERAYIADTADAWDEFARRILETVIDGRPVTKALIPRTIQGHYSESLRFWDPQRTSADGQDVSDLRTLLGFLEVTTDEEVSTTALERQGFALGRVLRGAA